MKVSVTPFSKKEPIPLIGQLKPGQTFNFRDNGSRLVGNHPARFQVIATEADCAGDLAEFLSDKHLCLCLNLSTGKFTVSDVDADAYNVLDQGKTELDWEG